VNGAGAAGSAIAKLLVCSEQDPNTCQSAREVILVDSQGIIHKKRKGLTPEKKKLARITNPEQKEGNLEEALQRADAFIGVSKGNILTASDIQKMNRNAIIFALANPVPEIEPALALQAGASIVGTGRSDFPNQINNALAFPGIFRGALDAKANSISNAMKLQAAYAIAATVPKPRCNHILPSVFDKQLVRNVADAVQKSANQ
jgi:malate dehydrogenase (oxaloacetate-decarboxylating)